MKKLRFSALVMAAVMCVSALTACSQSGPGNTAGASGPSDNSTQTETAGDLLSQIQQRGEIVVAMEGT